MEIVGVVADTRTESLSQPAEPEVYLPFWQNGAFSKHLVVRTASDPNQVANLVRREVHAVDPTASVEHFTTMAQIRRDSIAPRTFAMRLLIGFSILATGGTAKATIDLARKAGGKIIGIAFLIELDFLSGRSKLTGENVYSVLHY